MADKNKTIIEGLEREWCEALCSKDVKRMRSLVHPDFVLIGMRSTGPFMMHRDDWLEAIQKRDVESIELEIQDSAAFDNVLVGTVYAKWRLKYLGRVIEDCVVLTDVWVCDDNRWQAIRRHSTPSPSGGCAKA
ncbi:MAG: nuclear transport factor 2 family protein [Sphingomicrobium sp.]